MSIGVYLAFILDTDLFIPEPQKLGKDFMFLVLEHNLRNFIMYILGFLVSPILQLTDFAGSAFHIAIAYRNLGSEETISKLIPQGY